MYRRRYRNTWIAVCYGTEADGQTVLAQDIWFFNPQYVDSVRRCWRQICEWNGAFAGDPNYKWAIAPRPNNM